MEIRETKVENCFAESQTYEYVLTVTGGEFLEGLKDWSVRFNRKLRRPVGIAERDGVVLKTVLAGSTVRASFPDGCWQEKKREFEEYLRNLP